MLYALFYSLLSEPRIAWGLLILGFLVIVAPSLRRNRIYRSATLFAGLNTGILVTALLSGLLITGPHFETIRELRSSFTVPLPSVYVSSLIIGATIVPRYLLSSPTFSRAAMVILGTLIAYHVLTILISRLIWMSLLIATEGLPSRSQLEGVMEWLFLSLTQPHPVAVLMYIGPALAALIGTVFIMRTSRDLQG